MRWVVTECYTVGTMLSGRGFGKLEYYIECISLPHRKKLSKMYRLDEPIPIQVGDIVDACHEHPLNRVMRRLRRIGINIEFTSNIPWVYLHKVNHILIKERLHARHGFAISYSANDTGITYSRDMFRKIRELLYDDDV